MASTIVDARTPSAMPPRSIVKTRPWLPALAAATPRAMTETASVVNAPIAN
jgi:hypothetical protein